jgi:heme/copper-type cytochrome/quinol oxidase subunit 2
MKRGEKVNLKAASGKEDVKTLLITLSVIIIIYLIISSIAMYFSWKHNTKIG